MEKLDERYVAHFDMLGMSKLTLANPELAWEKLSHLQIAKQDMLNMEIEFIDVKKYIKDRLFSFTFSDTIIIFSYGNTTDDLLSIIMLTTQMFGRALYYSVPIRGAISYGKFMFNIDNNLFVGPPLINAYNIGEQSQWLGIIIDDMVAIQARDLLPTATDGQPTIIEWDVPIRPSGTRKHYVVNWPPIFRNNFMAAPPLLVETFYRSFAPLFGSYATQTEDVKAKYINTVAFINERLLLK